MWVRGGVPRGAIGRTARIMRRAVPPQAIPWQERSVFNTVVPSPARCGDTPKTTAALIDKKLDISYTCSL